jgi:drug/metabolite transporter (DMT)-like permease
MVLIVRPGGGLDPLGVGFALCNTAVTVAYYLLSRILARTETTLAMLFYSALVGAICFGMAAPWYLHGQAPEMVQITLFLSLGMTAGLGHYFVTAAHQLAGASLLAPITYLHLLWAGLLGWLVFGYVPPALTVFGMVVVSASGILIALRSIYHQPKTNA